jgi:hypothetical protein
MYSAIRTLDTRISVIHRDAANSTILDEESGYSEVGRNESIFIFFLPISELYSIDIVLPTIEGREIWLRRISKVEEEQQKILYQLQLELPERLEPIQIQNVADSAIP